MNENPDSQAPMSFESLLAELDETLARLEREDTKVDELTQTVAGAYDLVSELKTRLQRTEHQLKEVIKLREHDREK